MDVKKLVLLIGALIVAAVTAITAKNMFSGAGAPSASAKPAVPAGPEVLVATRSLPVGTIIDAESFRFQRWPEGLVQPAYYIKGKPGVRPADLVGTVVRNVRVLATDQRMDAKGEDGKAVVQRFTMVTLEATPKLAEKIAVAQKIGDLSLSLRSIADNSAELERAIASGEVKVPQTDDPKAERQMLLAIANQPADGVSTYTTGSDVSRFQRSTVPGAGKAKADPGDKIADAITAMAYAATGKAPPGSAPTAPAGPQVRVSRGNAVTIVPVGAK